MQSVLSPIFGKALDAVVEPVGRQVGYVYNYTRNVDELKSCCQKLKNKRESVKHEVEAAKNNGENIKNDVDAWLSDMVVKIDEIDKFLEDEGHKKTGCSNSLLPNLRLRHQLGRKAKKMTREGDELLKQANYFDGVYYRPAPAASDVALSDNEYVPFNSREEIVKRIMDALKDSTVEMIGVYGQGGVGKTTLVKEVARRAKDEKVFNVVVMANITSTPDMIKIQGEIADMLGLRLDAESSIGRAGRLQQRLKKEKNKTLIILDDLWAKLDLKMLGISFDDDDIGQNADKDIPDLSYSTLRKGKSPGDYKSCKILLTSRSKAILSSEMDVKSNFPVNVLDEEDAQKLFNKVVGITDEDKNLKQLSADIVNKCENLPMAIVTAGKALKNNKNKHAWKNALQQMKRQETIGVLEPVKFSTKLSYHHLESEELKSFFLLCARMGKDPLIMDLVKYCIGLGIFEGVYSVKEARDRADTLIKKLQDSSLLLDSYSSGRVATHDMVRDAAQSLAYEEQHILTLRYGKLDEYSDKDKLERYTAISLHHCDNIDEILEGLNFPRLKVLHVENKDPSLIIPDKLFEGMRELRVLILIGIKLSSLPASIKCLKKLRMLCLEQCEVGDDISIIGELKKLKVLSLSRSEFKNLPSELGQLSKLLLLDISNCTGLRVVPPNLLLRLISLEELYIENNLIQWSLEGQTSQSEIACLSELWHLEQLKRLAIHIQDVATLPRSWSFDNLDNYKVVIGDFNTVLLEDFKKRSMSEAARALALQLKEGEDISFKKGFIKMLLKSVDHLCLGELEGVQNVVNELNLEGFPCLKHLTIIKNCDIRYMISSIEGVQYVMAFPELESMFLSKLDRMETICNTLLTSTSFRKLKTIKINRCSRLKNLFPVFMVRHLTKLETIEVSECDSLEEIIVLERQEIIDNEDNILFPQLHTLTLQSLPRLTSFCASDKILQISRMDEIQFPNRGLEEISPADDQSVAAFIPLFNTKVSVQNLTEMNVKDCGSLKYLFSLSMVESLVKLQSLFVKGCAMMKDIFKPEDISPNEAMKEIDIFPQLKKIEITCMEELETVWHAQASSLSFRSLDFVIIKDCNKLVSVFPNHMVGKYNSLDTLEVMNCKLVEKIFDLNDSPQIDNKTNLWNLHIEKLQNLKHIWSRDPQGILDFKNLQNVHVLGCPDIENIFPISVAKDLSKLQFIRVSTCPKMQEIVAKEERSEETDIEFRFPQLIIIALERLPQLRSFYQGGHTIEFGALKRLYLVRCDKLETSSKAEPILLAVEEVICNLETMGLGPKEIEWLRNYVGNDVYQMHIIKALYLVGLKSMEILFWFLQRTPKLENLILVRCHNKEMLSSESLIAHEKIGTAVQLKSLRLGYFRVLQNIDFLNHPIIQRVEQLYLVDCSDLITLFPSSVSFSHLTYLEVSRCTRLENLMTSSTAKSLVQLMEMKVTHCEMMEEIVGRNEQEREDEIVFCKLKSLQLLSLRKLKSFCISRRLAFKFPSLEKLILRDCLRMENFCEKLTSIPNLQKVYVGEEEDKWRWEGDLNSTIKKIYEDMVFLEYAENLQLFQQELERVWQQGQIQMPKNWFRNLKSLVVENCFFPSSAFLSKLLQCSNLEKLEVRSCLIEEVIFDVDESNKMNGEAFQSQLKILTLKGLPSLKCVWSKDSHGLDSFSSLQEVVVNDCRNLETLFPASSMAENLVKLEISKCDALVEIVGKADATTIQESKTFELPKLTTLFLDDLPELKCFCPGMSTLDCPNLGFLRVLKCTKLDIFTSEIPCPQEAHGDEDHDGISTCRQLLFLIQKVIHLELDTLWLNKKMTSMLCHILQLDPESRLGKLKALKLFFGDDNETSTTLPFGFLQKVPNLTSLSIEHFNALEGMSCSTGLHKSWLNKLCKNLADLQVNGCSRLTQLTITECHGLVFLFSISVAKSLVQLELMIVTKCRSLEQIVGQEAGKSSSDEIIFEKLTTFTLNSLSSLVRFCSENVALQFPTLYVASIYDCPKMKIFSERVIRAPNFMAIQASTNPYDVHYYGDLNATVQKLFWDRVDVPDLILGDELEDIWRGVHPIPDRSFSILKSLVVDGCKFCSIVIPFHLLPFLSNLETLEVRNSDFVEAIFDVKDDDSCTNGTEMIIDARMKSPFSLPLKKLILEKLPSLEHIWTEDPQGILNLQCLQQVCVHECKSLTSLFPASVAIDQLEKLEVQCCEGLVEIVAKDETEAATKEFVFRYLNSLTLRHLKELKYFYSGLHHLEWPKLNELVVYHCSKLRTFTSNFHSHHEAHQQAIVSVEKVFPNLKELFLNKDDVKMFSQENFRENLFDTINCLKLMCFDCDQTPEFLHRFLRKVWRIKKLLVGCSRLRQILPLNLYWLKELELNNLPELVSIGLEHSRHSISQKLESLHVLECNSLIHLVPSTVSFSSLVDLTVRECHKLECLFTSSTAKSLALLKYMSISKCGIIKEIVAEELDDSDEDVIIFHQLETLSLDTLSALGCFYSGSSKLNFPLLQNVSIRECGRMKSFCQKAMVAPTLRRNVIAGIRRAHDDNNKVRRREKLVVSCRRDKEIFPAERPYGAVISLEPNYLPSLMSMLEKDDSWNLVVRAYSTEIPLWLEELELNNLPELTSIGLEHSWHLIPQELESLRVLECSKLVHLVPSTVSFSSLVDLTVRECDKLECLFTSSTAKSLTLLKNMSISKCNSIKEIVAEEQDDLAEDVIIFHQLETLSLHTLSTLGCFYSGSSKLNFPCLEDLSIRECDRMKRFCHKTLVAPKLRWDVHAAILWAHGNNTQNSASLQEVDGKDVGWRSGAVKFAVHACKILSDAMNSIYPYQEGDDPWAEQSLTESFAEQAVSNILSDEINSPHPYPEESVAKSFAGHDSEVLPDAENSRYPYQEGYPWDGENYFGDVVNDFLFGTSGTSSWDSH